MTLSCLKRYPTLAMDLTYMWEYKVLIFTQASASKRNLWLYAWKKTCYFCLCLVSNTVYLAILYLLCVFISKHSNKLSLQWICKGMNCLKRNFFCKIKNNAKITSFFVLIKTQWHMNIYFPFTRWYIFTISLPVLS